MKRDRFNIAFFANQFFRLDEAERLSMDRPDAFWRFIDSAIDNGHYVFMYMAYEAFSDDADKLPYPMAMAWQASPISENEFKKHLPAKEDSVVFNIKSAKGFDSYLEGFHKIKQALKEGYSYQVNYTFPLFFSFEGSWQKLAFKILDSQKTPFSSFLAFDNRAFVSCSPELFFHITNGEITAEPMKGTWEKPKQPEIDDKTRAENIMIVDLIRNDLGKICDINSIKIKLFNLIELPSLWQLTSRISGRLRENTSWKEIFTALFPSGSITGAPKESTQKIIKEVEGAYRGIYTGTMGFIAPNKDAIFNVSIRTLDIDIEKSRGRLGIGSGIVWDSEPYQEYKESLAKARFFIDAGVDFSLIETMRVQDKRIALLDLHLKRLSNSARFFGFLFNENDVLEKIRMALNELPDKGLFKLRLALNFWGDIDINSSVLNDSPNQFLITIYPKPLQSKDLLLYHKTTRRKVFEEALQYAQKLACDEALFINEEGFITQGSFTNVFVELNGRLATPPVKSGLLPGVLRQHLLDKGIAYERPLTEQDIIDNEAFVGNALRGLKKAVLK